MKLCTFNDDVMFGVNLEISFIKALKRAKLLNKFINY